MKNFSSALKSKLPIISKCFSVGSHGEVRHFRFYISPVLDEVGAFTGVLAFLEDITQQKQAEEAVRESGESYRLLFQYSPFALIERDASQLKAYLEQLRVSGVTGISDYLHKNPQEAANCMNMIKTVAVNDAFLRLLEADNPDQLESGLYPTDPDDFFRMAHEVILMIARGNISHERERDYIHPKGGIEKGPHQGPDRFRP